MTTIAVVFWGRGILNEGLRSGRQGWSRAGPQPNLSNPKFSKDRQVIPGGSQAARHISAGFWGRVRAGSLAGAVIPGTGSTGILLQGAPTQRLSADTRESLPPRHPIRIADLGLRSRPRDLALFLDCAGAVISSVRRSGQLKYRCCGVLR